MNAMSFEDNPTLYFVTSCSG